VNDAFESAGLEDEDYLEVAIGCERFAANTALEGPVARMSAHVNLQS
jgi:hypothetical protein